MSVDAATIMTQDVVTAGPDETVAQVARKLATHHISAVPVCDKDGMVLGMLSEGDLMRPFSTETEIRRAWWLRMLAEGTELAPAFLNYVREDQRRAKDLMVTPVITAMEQTPAREIADLMMQHHIKRVPIVRNGRLVGIVARADLVRAIARSPDALSELL